MTARTVEHRAGTFGRWLMTLIIGAGLVQIGAMAWQLHRDLPAILQQAEEMRGGF